MSDTTTVSGAVKAKAERLLADGKVTRTRGHMYRVHGDHDVYWVMVSYPEAGTGTCTCPYFHKTGTLCPHLLAACMYEIQNPPTEAAATTDPFEGLT